MIDYLHQNNIEDAQEWWKRRDSMMLSPMTDAGKAVALLVLEVTQLRKELERLHSIIDKP